jgi:hypothetical protein
MRLQVTLATLVASMMFIVMSPFALQAQDGKMGDRMAAQVELLGHDDFKVRQKATADLEHMLEASDGAITWLRKHGRESKDPEVKSRIEELIRSLDAVLQRIDPARERDMKSTESKNPVSVVFKNHSNIPVRVYWIDFEGKRDPRMNDTDLAPGRSKSCGRTYETHVWLITDTRDKALGLYVIGNKRHAKIIYRGAPQ